MTPPTAPSADALKMAREWLREAETVGPLFNLDYVAESLARLLDARAAAATGEEREACAKEADDVAALNDPRTAVQGDIRRASVVTARAIAATIRARREAPR